jgi:sulfoxide reductase catalytic subunit YedY
MLVKKGGGFKSSEITPYDMYLNRRAFIFGAAAAFALGPGGANAAPPAGQPLKATPNPAYKVEDPPTPVKDVTTYNNFYEFGVNKEDPARLAQTAQASPLVGPSRRPGPQAADVRHR